MDYSRTVSAGPASHLRVLLATQLLCLSFACFAFACCHALYHNLFWQEKSANFDLMLIAIAGVRTVAPVKICNILFQPGPMLLHLLLETFEIVININSSAELDLLICPTIVERLVLSVVLGCTQSMVIELKKEAHFSALHCSPEARWHAFAGAGNRESSLE